MILQNLRRERDDLHMLLRAQFADDRAEDTGSDRLGIGVDEDGRVGIEADSRPVGAVDVLRGTDDDGLVDVSLFHTAPRRRFPGGDQNYLPPAGETHLQNTTGPPPGGT